MMRKGASLADKLQGRRPVSSLQRSNTLDGHLRLHGTLEAKLPDPWPLHSLLAPPFWLYTLLLAA